MDDKVTMLSPDQLVDPWVLLRPVLLDSIDFLELKTSLSEKGFLNSISVRPSERKLEFYEIIDGMYRVTAARQLLFKVIPCIIKYDVSDKEALALQIEANGIRPETKPAAFAKQIRRLQKEYPDITIRQMSNLVNKCPKWISETLNLLRLDKKTQKAVDRGEMPLGNAYKLAAIPPRLRHEYIDIAKTMSVKEFSALATAVVKHFKETTRQGKLDAFFVDDFKTQPFLKSLKIVQAEVKTRAEAALVIAAENCKTPLDGWIAALKWAMHIDKGGCEQQEIAARKRVRKKTKGA